MADAVPGGRTTGRTRGRQWAAEFRSSLSASTFIDGSHPSSTLPATRTGRPGGLMVNRSRCRLLLVAPTAVATAVIAGPVPASAAPAPSATGSAIEVVATGLDNPRGLVVGPGGVVLVTEAGRGGPG